MVKITVVGKQQPTIEDDPLERPKRPVTYFSGLSGSGVRGSIDPRKLAPRLPTPFGESVGTAFEESLGRQSLAITSEIYDEYDSYIREIDGELGHSSNLFNPYNSAVHSGMDREQMLERFNREIAEMAQANPGLPVRTHEDILAAVGEKRQAVAERRAFAQAGEQGFTSGLGAFIGSSGGVLSDPVVLPTLFLGAPWSAGVVRFAATEAALGAGSTALAQASFQTSRRQVGEEPSLSEALEEIATAGIGAGVFGGLLRGGVAGIGRFRRALSDRRTRLQMAESLPPNLRTPDVDAAIAVERRVLDIEEANPLGRDVAAQAVHGQRYVAAERALAEGRILPRNQSIEGASFSHLSEADRLVMQELRRIANESPDHFGAWIEGLKKLPDQAIQEAETFAQYVQRQGGIDVDEAILKLDRATLSRIDDVSDILPLSDSKGKTFDQISEMAKREGYFAETPTPRQIIDALKEEIVNGRPLQRASVDVGFPVSVGRQISVLDRLGIPFQDLEPRQVAARLRAISSAEDTAANPQRTLRDVTDAEHANQASAKADNERVTQEAETKASTELDEARERLVMELYEGREDTILTFENADGSIERMTVRDMFERNKMEADELEALRFCLARGRG